MINVENLPCAFKRSVEERAVDELLALSEQCWTPDYKNIKRKEVLQESKEDLSSLTYKMLVIEDDTSCSSCKTPLAPWQVCVSTKEHEGGYILDPQSLDALAMNRAMASRKNPQIFTPARCCCNNFTPKDDRNEENSCAERDSVKDTKPKSSPFADQQAATNNIQDGGRLNRNASFPHAGFKFYHTEHTDFYINSYRKQVTDHYIRKHIQWRIRENNINAVKRPPKKLTQEVKSKTIPKPSFTFYSFRISKKSSCDNGVLKIGPCPRHLPEQNDSKKARFSKIKTQSSIQSTEEKTMEPQKESKPLIMTNLAFQSSPLARTDNTMIISGLDRERNVNDAPKTESSDGKLKKVQLKVDCPTESPRIVARGRANKSANKCKVSLKTENSLKQQIMQTIFWCFALLIPNSCLILLVFFFSFFLGEAFGCLHEAYAAMLQKLL